MIRILAPVALASMLAGCAVLQDARVTNAGLPVHEDSIQLVDLPLVLDPTAKAAPSTKVQTCIENNGVGQVCAGIFSGRSPGKPFTLRKDVSGQDEEDAEERFQRLRLETALWAFYEVKTSSQTLEARRTQVQQRLVMAADTNCGIFINRIFEVQASGNFAFGTAATLLGGAGSIVTDAPSARLLSGLSAMTTGIRAEANEDFFRKQWIEALAKAIENERTRLRDDMKKRASENITVYPVQAAIADALRYNDACSLVSGLKEVNRAVTIADDPAGLRAFRDTYERAGFNPQFTATLTSDGEQTTTRVRAASRATASVALIELAAQLATLRTEATAVKGKLPASDEVDANKKKIDDLIAKLGDDDGYGPDLKAPLDKLGTYKSEYDALATTLATAPSEEKRQETFDLMEANDAASEKIRSSAARLISTARGKIQAVLAEAELAAREEADKKAAAKS